VRTRILDFVQTLRTRGGLEVSVAESLDALVAVAAIGVEREPLREALAAALVKHEEDRPAFDRLFDEAFPLVGGAEEGRRRRRGAGGGTVPTGAGRGAGDGARPGARAEEGERGEPGRRAAAVAARREAATARHEVAGTADAARRESRAARVRRLLALPFREFTSRDVEEARELVRELGARLRGRLARRERQARRGRVDFRRTIRHSMSSGGVPVRPRFRARRPGRPDLVALCDLSGSVAAASELLLGLMAPAAEHFRRVQLFAFVDRLCPVSIERGHVAPGGPLDLHARSDFGRVLVELWEQHRPRFTRSTLLLVLGDARNNRLPPRADLLRAIADRVQRIVWLVPEPRARWDTGDSVLGMYAPACDAVVECVDLGALVRAVRQTL
jgi:uncharacterized protein with von Willebrand factor type A (vWA) domain